MRCWMLDHGQAAVLKLVKESDKLNISTQGLKGDYGPYLQRAWQVMSQFMH